MTLQMRKPAAFLSACAGMALLWRLAGGGWIVAAVLAVLLPYTLWAQLRFWQQTDQRLKRCFGLLGAGEALAAALACRLNALGQTGWAGLLMIAAASVCLAPAMAQSMIWVMQGLKRCGKPIALAPRKASALGFCVILLCWLPVLIALLPGVTGYDMQSQIHQITTGSYVNGHPIAHTLLVGVFYRLGGWLWGNPSLGIALFTVCQALCVAGAMAYALYWLCLRRCPRAVWAAVLILFALAPQHPVMAGSLTKDVLFAAALLMVTIELCRWATEPERARRKTVIAMDVALLVAAGLLRRNMVLAYMVLAAVLAARALGKGRCRRLLALLLCGMMLALGCESALKKAVNAQEPTNNDLVAIPCQQLARVYALYGLEHPVGYEIRERLPWAYAYSPERADAAKRGALVNGPGEMTGFLKMWLREAASYPVEYLDAFLLTNKAYWDWNDTAYAYTYDDEAYGPRGVMTVNHNIYSNLEKCQLLPRVRQLLDEWFTENRSMQILPVRLIIHPALWTWMLLFGFTWMIYERRRAALIGFALPLAYLCTLLLGPCALIRYCYCVMLAAPVLMGRLCCSKEEGVTLK